MSVKRQIKRNKFKHQFKKANETKEEIKEILSYLNDVESHIDGVITKIDEFKSTLNDEQKDLKQIATSLESEMGAIKDTLQNNETKEAVKVLNDYKYRSRFTSDDLFNIQKHGAELLSIYFAWQSSLKDYHLAITAHIHKNPNKENKDGE